MKIGDETLKQSAMETLWKTALSAWIIAQCIPKLQGKGHS